MWLVLVDIVERPAGIEAGAPAKANPAAQPAQRLEAERLQAEAKPLKRMPRQRFGETIIFVTRIPIAIGIEE